jgi:hypothetical protein
VTIDRTRDFLARRRSVPADEMMGTKGDARNAETALHARGDDERTRQQSLFLGGNPFECDDAPPARRLRRHRARHFRITVDQHETTTTLSLRLASVFN